ncbi:MAG: archaetidylserine decarboxylase [Spirochaetia bacterium]|nr:archaetidylserine decarboxylase [Spirochaetia bacterium]
MIETLDNISGYVWGLPLIVLLIGVGIFLTLRLALLQFRYFIFGIRIAFGFADKEEYEILHKEESEEKSDKKGDISPFQALTTALSATVGTGNIVGVAGAILVGGPGALFWMWVTAFFGMATKYGEALLAVKYRIETDKGFAGGPMYYITRGLGQKWLGILFALFTVIAALGIGNMVQINAAAGVLENSSFEIPRYITSAVVAFLAGLVILGGIKRIGKVTAFFVPFMALFYIAGGLWIIAKKYEFLPMAFSDIFYYAFSPLPAVTGVGMGILLITIQSGVTRGLFSNEAGLGSASIAAASAKTDYPVKQGLVAMLGPFIDTLILCSITGLVIILGLKSSGAAVISNAAAIKSNMFQEKLPVFLDIINSNNNPGIFSVISNTWGASSANLKDVLVSVLYKHILGDWGGSLVALGLFFFASSTIIGWYYYSDRALVFLGAKKLITFYKILYVGLIFAGGLAPIEIVWKFSDIANGFMALPNLIALILLSPVIASETRNFFKKYPHKHDFAVKMYLYFLKLLPKNKLSKILGFLAGLHLPKFVMIPILIAFSRIFRIDVKEAELELSDYRSLNKFFTRALKNGTRIIEPNAHTIVSPVDGRIINYGKIEDGKLFQSKGIDMNLDELLGSNVLLDKFKGGLYSTIYLSPQDYHRIHSPYSGNIVGYYYKPGKLYPVNPMAVNSIDGLFSRNERLITYIETKYGTIAIIKVGATSVGRIKVKYDDTISTNKWRRLPKEHFYDKAIHISKGDELGRFEMGSTIILLIEKGTAEFLDIEERQKLLYGQPIALFNDPRKIQKIAKNSYTVKN